MYEILAWTRLTAWLAMTNPQSLASRPRMRSLLLSGTTWLAGPPLRIRSDAMLHLRTVRESGNDPRFYSRPCGHASNDCRRTVSGGWGLRRLGQEQHLEP